MNYKTKLENLIKESPINPEIKHQIYLRCENITRGMQDCEMKYYLMLEHFARFSQDYQRNQDPLNHVLNDGDVIRIEIDEQRLVQEHFQKNPHLYASREVLTEQEWRGFE